VVITTPAPIARRIIAGLPRETDDALGGISYGPYVVGAFLTSRRRQMPWDRIYALATPKRSFSMLFNTSNVLGAVDPGPRAQGTLMVYAAANLARALEGLDDDAVASRFHADLRSLYPELGEVITETGIQRWQLGLPHPTVGRARLQGALTKPLGRIHLAGDYLGSWYTETAAYTGEAAAAAARSDLLRPQIATMR
jgi:oxygen-dependent protoporphyrinogen oxidase